MAKNKKDLDLADSSNLNQIKKSTNVVFNILFVILALTCIIPVVFIFIISITSEQSIKMNGYQFIPESYSLDAYKFLFREGEMILRALGVSVLVTAVGTTLGVILTMLMGYVLSRSNYKSIKGSRPYCSICSLPSSPKSFSTSSSTGRPWVSQPAFLGTI